MNELLNIVLFSIIGTIISLCIITFFQKKKHHKDFKAVVITFSFFTLVCSYLSVTGLIDILKARNGYAQSTSGICDIVKFDDVGGRFGSDAFYQIIVNDITVEADAKEFSFLKEGTYKCTIQYGENSHSLIDIQLN